MPTQKTPRQLKNQSDTPWADRLRYFESRSEALVATIREFVEVESPSDNKLAADRMGASWHANSKRSADAPRCIAPKIMRTTLQIDFPGRETRSPFCCSAISTRSTRWARWRTCRAVSTNGRLHGPGVLDMKSGIALMFYAIEALQAMAWQDCPRPVTVFLVSDEEVGSNSSRKITEALAKESAAVLVLEPAAGLRGAVKTARKGVGEYTLTREGRRRARRPRPRQRTQRDPRTSAQITAISKLNDLKQGLSVNAGVIRGGTRTNVIAAEAVVEIDARIVTPSKPKLSIASSAP